MTDDPSMLGFQSYLLERFEYRFSKRSRSVGILA
jgi:hypothetical protein